MISFLKNVSALFFTFLLCACLKIEKPNSISCDAEQSLDTKLKGVSSSNRFASDLMDGAYLKSKERAKSGIYAIKLTPQNPYGFTYQINNVKAGEHFKVSVWRHRSNSNGSLVVSAPNVNDLFIAQSISNGNLSGNWEELCFDFFVPSLANAQDIKVFAWSNDTVNPIFFDDLCIEYLSEKPPKITAPRFVFIDKRDNKKYDAVKIGKDWWMAENLNFALNASCRCYDDAPQNCTKYGRLYDFNAALKACPEGWRLPTDEDWKNLERSLGMKENELDKYGWRVLNETQKLMEFGSSGFKGYLTGTFDKKFYYLFVSSYYWTASQINDSSAWCREISKRISIGSFKDNKRMRFSVRCILNIKGN